MIEDGKDKAFNANTVKKDVGVLLQNYAQPYKPKSFEDYSSLLIDLDLVRVDDGGKSFAFNIEGKRKVPMEIFLYVILQEKGKDKSVSYDTLQEIGLMFCMTDAEVIGMAEAIGERYSEYVQYSDNAGIRQLLFKEGSSLRGIDVLFGFGTDESSAPSFGQQRLDRSVGLLGQEDRLRVSGLFG